ncbi:MAG: YafY family transcriptional regulator [Ktedonobacteraceae bacterium]|nr:YafY family transcriptional regulator [Ktedonobacteraceae bacterium]
MRADRLLSILLLLQVHQRVTARELAQRLEVSQRTIHRDMDALCTAGIPIVAERGVGGGWGLLEEYRTNLTGLSEAEIQVLFLGKPTPLLADLGLHQASEGALIKLLAALPEMRRRDAECVRQRIHIDVSSWHPTQQNITQLPILQEAIWRERKLRIVYQRGESSVERIVDPLGLVAKGSTWYVVACVEGQERNYRVSRIQAAELLELPCIRPPNFDLASSWSRSSALFRANLPCYPVCIRCHTNAVPLIYQANRRVEQVSEADDDDWITLQLQFETEAEARGYILSFGLQVEILEPLGLREQMIELAQSVLAHYSS